MSAALLQLAVLGVRRGHLEMVERSRLVRKTRLLRIPLEPPRLATAQGALKPHTVSSDRTTA